MQKTNSVEGLKCDLEKLQHLTDALVPDLSQINEKIRAGRLLPEGMGKKIADCLYEINQIQTELKTQFASLKLGELPEQTAELERILEEYQKKQKLKNKYLQVVSFFMSLHSEEEAIEKLLDRKKMQLALLDLESAESEEEFQQTLEPYILLKNTLEETDDRKKFSLMYQLAGFYEEAIFSGLGRGKITSSQEELCSTAEAETPSVPEAAALEPEKLQNSGEESAIGNADTGEKEIADTVAEENTSILAANIWEELGVEDASALCHREQTELLSVQTAPKAADKFGTSKFKNEIGKQSCKEKIICMVEALDGCAYSKKSIAVYYNRKAGYYDLVTDKLYQLGYLKKYSVEGMGEFFTLSERGDKAFSSKESFNFLQQHSPYVRKPLPDDGENIEDTANAAMTRLLCCECYEKTLQVDRDYTFWRRTICLSTDFFTLILPDVMGSLKLAYFGIVSENPEEFQRAQEKLANLYEKHKPDYLIVVEPDKKLAFQMVKWVAGIITPEVWVGYSVYGEKGIFDASTGALLEILPPDEDIEEPADEPETLECAEEPETSAQADVTDTAEYGETIDETVQKEEIQETEAEKNVEEKTEEIPEYEEITMETAVSGENAEEAIEETTEEAAEEAVEEAAEEAAEEFIEETAAESVQEKQPENPAVSGTLLTESEKQDYNAKYQEMLASGKFYAATTFLKSLSKQFSYYEPVYRQVAYALNDPMENCSYSSDSIINVFYEGETPVSDYFVISAAIRDYFYDQFSYEYSLPQLQSMVSGSEVLQEIPSVERIVYLLQKFKTENQKGMDRYADYREKERAILEKRLEKTKQEAKGYYQNYSSGNMKENASHKRFIETSKLLLGPKSDLSEYLKMVADDNRDMVELLEEFLSTNYVKDHAAIREENIEPAKIDRILDEYWNKAAQNMRLVKKTSDLMSSLRMNLFKKVQKVVSVLCNYVFLCKSSISMQDDPADREYKRNRKDLLSDIEEALSVLGTENPGSLELLAGKNVLAKTLMEIKDRIDGTYKEGSYKYFYMDFLKNDKILLDESFLPILDEVLELPEFSVRSRILRHCEESSAEHKSWEERIDDIYKHEDNYGSAELIFRYVEDQEIPFENLAQQHSKMNEAMSYPKTDMENNRKGFIEDLELAQSYGQMDSTVENTKEIILQIMENWFVWAKDTMNYGFFSQILNAFLEKIHKDAEARKDELNNDLKVYLEKNKEYESNQAVSAVVKQIKDRIDQQNYAAAEDLLNRLIRNDLELDENVQQQTDYLLEFLEEYDINYKKTAKSGATLKSLVPTFRNNKDTKGANKLLENWPKGASVGETTIRSLLDALGFDTAAVKQEPRLQGKIESYLITLKRPQNGRKSNYKHPISAFGSEAETKGFRVVCLFGKTDASRLIDTFKEIGNAKNTLVLLDYALSLADRRILARKTKTDLSSKIFAVLDRVAVLYLAKHYAETAVNRMLMYIVMPFASYQPYINKSADVMPQEIFIGRRYELEKIESPTGVNLVYGGRQLGKTALLRMAKKDIDMNENGDRAIIVNAWEKDYRETAKAVSAALFDEGIIEQENITDDWSMIARDIKNRLRDTAKPIPYFLLMIDEADTFIESCAEVNYQPFDALKEIQGIGAGRFKFVFAGLRNIVRFKQETVLKNNIGLVHLESLTVKPFKAMEARELLEVPLSYLGFRFPKDNETEVLISTIFGTTNYFPGLLQLYCTKMIEAMRRDYAGYPESETPPYYVKKEHIKKVLAEQSLQDDIYDKFLITLKVDGDDYYYIIALLVAYHYHEYKSSNGCNAEELLKLADGYSIKKIAGLDKDKLTALMEEMRELNVLQHTGDGRYRFTRHSFCQMMGTTQHIDDELEKYMED